MVRTLLLATLGIGSIAMVGAHPARGAEVVTLRIVPSGLCLECSTFTVTLEPDGDGVFVGERGTAVKGARRFRATPAQARAFRAVLAPYRPVGERRIDGPPSCRTMATDQDSADVRWRLPGRRDVHLFFYAGCDMGANRNLAAALFGAADRLPIADLIGRR